MHGNHSLSRLAMPSAMNFSSELENSWCNGESDRNRQSRVKCSTGYHLLWFDLETVLSLVNPKIRRTPLCAGTLGAAPNRSQFRNSKIKTLLKDIEVL